ncbi:MAG TPA: hypothetical protein VGC20_13070, partial [bacterium]
MSMAGFPPAIGTGARAGCEDADIAGAGAAAAWDMAADRGAAAGALWGAAAMGRGAGLVTVAGAGVPAAGCRPRSAVIVLDSVSATD